MMARANQDTIPRGASTPKSSPNGLGRWAARPSAPDLFRTLPAAKAEWPGHLLVSEPLTRPFLGAMLDRTSDFFGVEAASSFYLAPGRHAAEPLVQLTAAGLVRTVKIEVPAGAGTQNSAARVELELSDFNAPVSIRRPDADEPMTLREYLGRQT